MQLLDGERKGDAARFRLRFEGRCLIFSAGKGKSRDAARADMRTGRSAVCRCPPTVYGLSDLLPVPTLADKCGHADTYSPLQQPPEP
jgi:hypothetical protein